MRDYARQSEQVMPSFVTKWNLERALGRQNSVLRYQQILYNYVLSIKLYQYFWIILFFILVIISLSFIIIQITRMNLILID